LHTGLEVLGSVVPWRGLPMDGRIEVRMWRVPASEVSREEAGQVSWLSGWCRIIDDWIATCREEPIETARGC
jgi:hypothetical protein